MTLQLPEPGEARALADDLRDMMASGQLDQSVLRRAANALDAFAHHQSHVVTISGPSLEELLANVELIDSHPTGDPFDGQLLASFENGGGDGDAEAIDRVQ